jgi:hypothetical protein
MWSNGFACSRPRQARIRPRTERAMSPDMRRAADGWADHVELSGGAGNHSFAWLQLVPPIHGERLAAAASQGMAAAISRVSVGAPECGWVPCHGHRLSRVMDSAIRRFDNTDSVLSRRTVHERGSVRQRLVSAVVLVAADSAPQTRRVDQEGQRSWSPLLNASQARPCVLDGRRHQFT